MEYKTYKKDAEYSYSLGAFPTLELVHHQCKQLIKVIVHSTFMNETVLKELKEMIGDRLVFAADKQIERLAAKENVYVIGIFKKYQTILQGDNPHLILVNPANMGNLGTIMRTACGFGITNLGIIKPAVDYFDPKVIRSSMGACFQLHIQCFDSFAEYSKAFPEHVSYPFMLDAQRVLKDIKYSANQTTFVFGNEATGLDASFKSPNAVVIPHLPTIDSLNLPTAVGIALNHFFEQTH